jgi:hypothetical protein
MCTLDCGVEFWVQTAKPALQPFIYIYLAREVNSKDYYKPHNLCNMVSKMQTNLLGIMNNDTGITKEIRALRCPLYSLLCVINET